MIENRSIPNVSCCEEDMRVLLKVIISRNPDGVHINQFRSNGEWEHISSKGFDSLGISYNFGSVIHLAVKPFHLSSSMNKSPLSKMSIFMENSYDRSFLGVKMSSSSHNIWSSQFMIINVDFLSVFVGLSCQDQLVLQRLPYQPNARCLVDWIPPEKSYL